MSGMGLERITELLEKFILEDINKLEADILIQGKNKKLTISRPANVSNVIDLEIMEVVV